VDDLAARLRAAGCVFAEEEAAVLRDAAQDTAELACLTDRRLAGEPLEHVVGRVGFGGQVLSVGPAVFVPRQRTLLLAGLAADAARPRPAPVVVEVCAGVAPVAAVVAAALPGAQVHAADVDDRALAHAARNLPADAGVHAGHLLDALPDRLRGRVSVLAAVAPYVPAGRAGELPREARDHEPAAALYGGPDGLDLVRELVDTAAPWLAPDGVVLLELARSQWTAAAAHARRAGWRPASADHAEVPTRVLVLRRGRGRTVRG
jgi:release factor glutamine methyltransferase